MPDRVPLARSKSWPRSRGNDCKQRACQYNEEYPACTGTPQDCDDEEAYSLVTGSDTIAEWAIADVNQDGFPDFVTQTGQTQVCDDLPSVSVWSKPRVPPNHNQLPSVQYIEYRAPHSEDLYRGNTVSAARTASFRADASGGRLRG